MAKNMGVADRVIRAIIAVIFALLIVLGTVKGAAAWVLGILAIILLGTSAVGYCGLYKVLGICTLKEGGSSSGEKPATT
ncbi:MAG: YgaP family membrane protein [Armatimonadota bacterium]